MRVCINQNFDESDRFDSPFDLSPVYLSPIILSAQLPPLAPSRDNHKLIEKGYL